MANCIGPWLHCTVCHVFFFQFNKIGSQCKIFVVQNLCFAVNRLGINWSFQDMLLVDATHLPNYHLRYMVQTTACVHLILGTFRLRQWPFAHDLVAPPSHHSMSDRQFSTQVVVSVLFLISKTTPHVLFSRQRPLCTTLLRFIPSVRNSAL